MNVWGHTDPVTGIPNGFVTGIEFRTTRTNKPQVLGVQEGQRYYQGLGNGHLVGFQGRAGYEVDAIGAIYEE
ncbi:hypothetical protein BDV23DRAFT_153542 [Aspergillus alliaceus]|nr:hypothetical protein BDV23DRAFT_153542 [Aspergillus alliaceus]